MIIMDRRGQTSMPRARFEPTDSASKRSRPTPQTLRRLGPAISLRTKQFYTSISYSLSPRSKYSAAIFKHAQDYAVPL
jgi:hypothetical protein